MSKAKQGRTGPAKETKAPAGRHATAAFGLIGQVRASRLLTSLLNADSFPPLLFAGPEGVGKRTAALRLAQAANCSESEDRPCGRCSSCRTIATLRHPDVRIFFPLQAAKSNREDDEEKSDDIVNRMLEEAQEHRLDRANPGYNPRHGISIDVIRWMRREMAKPPMLARHRFFIILHAHRMKAEAANAFLKTLEEPQRQTGLVLTTDRPGLFLDTIRSRCRLVRFSPLGREQIGERLIAEHGVGAAEAELAAIVAGGSLGKAVRFAAAPDTILVRPVLDFFALPAAGTADVLRTMSELTGTPLFDVTYTLFFLFRQTMLFKLGIDTAYARHNPAVKRRAESSSLEYLSRAASFLAGRLEDCRLNIYSRLFLYTLLSAVRPTRTG